MGLSFTIAVGPRQRHHSHVTVPRDSWPHFTVSDSRLPQRGGPRSRIYIPQEQGGPVISPGTGFLSLRLLRLAGLRWRYSTSPPHGSSNFIRFCTIYVVSKLNHRKHIHCQATDIFESHSKHLFCCQEFVYYRPLPNNGSTWHSIILIFLVNVK
jgi:hypothetical protein